MKEFLKRKEKGYFCSVTALILTALGLIFFRMLTEVSVEQSERPILVVAFAFAAILFDLIASYKDYGKVPSIAAYALSTLAFFTLLEGRVSYLAFYFSGDVMDTGLSLYLVIAFLCFLAAMALSLLTVVFEEDKAGTTVFSQADIKVILPMALVTAVLCAIVAVNMNTTGAQEPGLGTATTPEATQPVEAGTYKTPTIDEATWQGYSADDYTGKDVSSASIAYQLIGHADITAGGDPQPFDALLNLYEDGLSILTVYGRGNAYTYYGYWTNVDDENLWFCVAHYAIAGQPGTCTIDYSYDLTGHFDEITLNVALGFADGGQFIREMPISGDGSIQHTSIETWLADLGWTAPDPVETSPEETDTPDMSGLLFSFTSDSENYLLDCYADGTYKFTFVTVGLEETGTWTWKDWSFSLTDTNGKVTTAETDPDTHALKLHFVAAINEQVNRDFAAESSVWGTAFNGEGAYAPAGSATGAETGSVLFSFLSDSENYLLDCYADGTYKFTFVTAGLEETGTWTWKDWSFSLTDTNGKVTTAETDPDTHALKLHFVAAINEQVNRDFAAESSVWGTAFNGEGTYTP